MAVLINHLGQSWLPGGFLGVDLFFVISGYVVTASLARREEATWRQMLAGFYSRRFRRLLPALLLMVAITAVIFGLFVSSADDQYGLSMRTGLASLFGLSNLVLLAQGNNYFALGTQFNPFLHTWSLAVEEQFYLIWPLIVMLCGVGLKRSKRISLLRLLVSSVFLSIGSFVLYLHLSQGDGSAAFYLMPARFWELSAGAIIFLLQSLQPLGHQKTERSAFWGIADWVFFVLILAAFSLPEARAVACKPLFVVATSALLATLQKSSALGRVLSHPFGLALGTASYSIYLWHWPLIVLLRWTFGVNALTFMPLIVAISVAAAGSNQIETRFRFGEFSGNWQKHPLILYPLVTALTACFVAGIWKVFGNTIFLGTSSHDPQNFTVSRSISGTTVTTYNCFVEPDAPLAASREINKCQTQIDPQLPTVFLEGDSIAHSLVPLLERLHKSRRYNVSFFARGSCITPFVKPWADNRHLLPRYQRCPEHAQIREEILLGRIKPGDKLVLATTNAYVQGPESQSNYLQTISSLATVLKGKGAELILFSPFPSFTGRASIKTPLSLCFREWFRPDWALSKDCMPVKANRRDVWAYNATLKNLQERIQKQHDNVKVFDPFDILCPPGDGHCSTHLGGTMMFYDGIHLSAAGARYLYPFFQSLLQSSSR